MNIIDGTISSQDIALFSVIFIQFLLFYFPGYNVNKSKSGNIEMVFEPLYIQSYNNASYLKSSIQMLGLH